MKSRKYLATLGIFCLAMGLLGICFIAPVSKYSIADLHFRHNEISCSHTGVNPFLIWSHKIESETYQPLALPEKSFFGKPDNLLPANYECMHIQPGILLSSGFMDGFRESNAMS